MRKTLSKGDRCKTVNWEKIGVETEKTGFFKEGKFYYRRHSFLL